MQQHETLTEAPATKAATCDRPDASGAPCTAAAVTNYSWEWGENGVCCATHQFLLQQVAGQISRAVNFHPIAAPTALPMTRDERAKLAGELYAANAEIEDLKGRGLELYRENEVLARQAQAASVRGRETERQLQDATREIDRLQVELQKRDAEHGTLTDELSRLRTLERYTSERNDRNVVGAERGLDPAAAAADAGAQPPTKGKGKG